MFEKSLDDISLHDSVIVGWCQRGRSVRLSIESAEYGDRLVDGYLQLSGVEEITRDDQVLSCFQLKDKRSEILACDPEENGLYMVVNGRLDGLTSYTAYRFKGASVVVSFEVSRFSAD